MPNKGYRFPHGKANPNYHHGYGNNRSEKHHPLYAMWRQMRDRCNNPNSHKYQYYGALGVKVCTQWNDFATFLADVGERPHPNLTLDRYPNKNGNYEPGNIRWATIQEQNSNKRPYRKRKSSARFRR
jgi:hypothetical protein